MAVLATLKKDRLGEWPTLSEYLADLRRRETNSVAALAALLSAPAEEQREIAQGSGLGVLIEIASDLRLPKGSRLAAARCAVEAGASGDGIAALFIGAGDLATDPRLGGAAKKLVESGLPAALAGRAGAEVSLEAGAFARAAHASASVVGQTRLRELMAPAVRGHAGVSAAMFAIGAAEMAAGDRERWAKLLQRVCAANRSAPAAAKRLGLAPPWPPSLPDAFAPLVQEAEKAAANVTAPDAAATPPKTAAHAPAPRASGRVGPPLAPRPAPPTSAHAAGPPSTVPASLPTAPAPARTGTVELGKKVVAPIKPSLFRRPLGTVVEGPLKLPPKPMPPVAGRPAPAGGTPPPPASPRAAAIPDAAPIRRAPLALGPFAQRLRSLFDDRPEAVERLCAAIEARAAVHGLPAALAELGREVSHPRWKGVRAPPGQLERLAAAARAQPEPWRAAAGLLLDRLRSEGG
ncbi:MAG: hypothetical protein ACJ79H_02750 [Myxococcales bacterium]